MEKSELQLKFETIARKAIQREGIEDVLKYLDENEQILNFYCVKNEIEKSPKTEDFKKYCELRDSSKAFYIKKGCSRNWSSG